MRKITYKYCASLAIKIRPNEKGRLIVKISKTVEVPNGSIQFEGELNDKELDLVLEVGLNVLLAQGAIPFTLTETMSVEEDEEKQERTFH